MCRTQCLLALVALYVGLTHSWDIAVGVGNQLIFYTDGSKTNTVNLISRNLAALAYDDVHNRMLYVDKQSNNDAICGFNLHSEENKCFIERTGSNINSIAFDPATQTLFFTDTNDNSINSISLKPGSVNNVNANLLIKMDNRTPSDITVDSCAGYIYWTNPINKKNYNNESMERARFNGSGREIINSDYLNMGVFSLVVDPLTRNMYYFNFLNYNFIFLLEFKLLNYGNLYAEHERVIYDYINIQYSAVKELTVSKDYLYWVNSSESYTTVWQLPKNANYDPKPNKISTFYTEKQPSIATNYKIEDQIQGLQDCEALSSLIPITTVTNNSLNIEQTTEYTTDGELFCVHGVHVSETSICNCTSGYIGERCDVSVCHNYCLQGNCSLNDEGLPTCSEPVCECKGDYVGDRCEVSDCLNYCMQGNCSVNNDGFPTCRCNAGYSGKRCEVYACFGYCLNDGACFLNEEDEPICQCTVNHEGSRCETDTSDTATDTPTYDLAKGNLTLADLLSRWRKPSSKMFLTVEV